MEAWEYAVIVRSAAAAGVSASLTWTPPTGVAETFDVAEFVSILNRVGRLGWELVAATGDGSRDTYVFRRKA
jgi:hypothetical protein